MMDFYTKTIKPFHEIVIKIHMSNMLAVLLLSLLQHEVRSEIVIPVHNAQEQALTHCITDVLQRYYTDKKELTFFNIHSEGDFLLKAVHSLAISSLIVRQPNHKLKVQHEGYLITSKNANDFTNYLKYLIRERTWNPYARIFIIIRHLRSEDLDYVFSALLKQHVFNVLLINGTENTELYSYNPFKNYACGKRYDEVISYGHCSNNTQDLFPNKLVTGLRNCTFNIAVPHWPPYTINPMRIGNGPKVGAEQSILQLISDLGGFKLNFTYIWHGDEFSTVSEDMVAVGMLSRLQNGEVDIFIGGMLLVPSRANAFTYVYEHLTYIDEIRFIVKRATFVAAWKNVYLEFNSNVWALLFLSLILFWVLMIVLLHLKDKTYLMLRLLDVLLLHGFYVRCRLPVKCVIILWVWFAYLVNTYYQSSLVSITTNPVKEYQVSTEKEAIVHKFRSCVSVTMRLYYRDVTQINHTQDEIDGCHRFLDSLATVANTSDLYTITLYSLYKYNKRRFCDEFGTPLIYSFERPYAKVIYGIYLYKGFPMHSELSLNALRIRENGLADKLMNDIYYLMHIKYHYRAQELHLQFANPFLGYVAACVVAFIVFVVEILSNH